MVTSILLDLRTSDCREDAELGLVEHHHLAIFLVVDDVPLLFVIVGNGPFDRLAGGSDRAEVNTRGSIHDIRCNYWKCVGRVGRVIHAHGEVWL